MARLVLKDSSVNIHGLMPEMQCVLTQSHKIWTDAGYPHVITSARDGIHGPNSYHYFGYALDLRTWGSDNEQLGAPAKADLAKKLREALKTYSDFFDVHVEDTHIHVEYDWTRAQLSRR